MYFTNRSSIKSLLNTSIVESRSYTQRSMEIKVTFSIPPMMPSPYMALILVDVTHGSTFHHFALLGSHPHRLVLCARKCCAWGIIFPERRPCAHALMPSPSKRAPFSPPVIPIKEALLLSRSAGVDDSWDPRRQPDSLASQKGVDMAPCDPD